VLLETGFLESGGSGKKQAGEIRRSVEHLSGEVSCRRLHPDSGDLVSRHFITEDIPADRPCAGLLHLGAAGEHLLRPGVPGVFALAP